MAVSNLLPGDVLLYKAIGFYGHIISLKTWHPIAHVEMYIGDYESIASRDGLGTGIYPWRLSELVKVCRPIQPFDLKLALYCAKQWGHQPYGWKDLLQFAGWNVQSPGIVCSPYITKVSRWGNLDPFNGEPAEKIAPFEFELSNVYQISEFAPN